MAEYIERAEAIKAVCDSIPHSCSLDDCQKECQEVSAIVSIPAADVRPVLRGTWVGIDDFPYEDWECDNCGCVVGNTDDPWNYSGLLTDDGG